MLGDPFGMVIPSGGISRSALSRPLPSAGNISVTPGIHASSSRNCIAALRGSGDMPNAS